MNRRELLIAGGGLAGGMLLTGGLRRVADAAIATTDAIDRKALVSRHNPVVHQIDPFSALTVGNGNFAFTADATGLQTFTEDFAKEFPLCTTSHWAWHTIPAPPGIKAEDYKFKEFDVQGRKVGYATDSKDQKVLYDWLRENPHRLHLGRIGLQLKNADGSPATSKDISAINQKLDLWAGTVTSNFQFAGQPVSVRTCCHPDMDAVAVKIESPLLASHALMVRIAFPYGSSQVEMADWNSPAKHRTVCQKTDRRADFARSLDSDSYVAALTWSGGGLVPVAEHEYLLESGDGTLEFVMRFAPEKPESVPTADETFAAAEAHWQNFWSTGGAIDFTGSTDTRADELERRVVLSQYNTALHSAGSMPPGETGLLNNACWYGKPHLEMHWWHAAHFAVWGRFALLEKSLDYYHRIKHVGKATALRQGYEGVRWPKMVGPDGRDSPSPIAPLLIWQQPHPIYYAELCYRQNPTRQILDKWSDIVFESAKFMASYPILEDNRYVLGPPMKTVSENADTHTTTNPTFELAYWRFGLQTAQKWRERLQLDPDPKWADILTRLSPLPTKDGLYLMQEDLPDTYTNWAWEHPALLGAYGAQPGYGVDIETMRRTLKKVMEVWDWDRCWGWDFPMAAMTAAKLGEGEIAVKALMIDSPKNRYHPNGHVYQRPNLTAYLPANGGLLGAIAMMAKTPNGFPTDGKWTVRAEGLTLF